MQQGAENFPLVYNYYVSGLLWLAAWVEKVSHPYYLKRGSATYYDLRSFRLILNASTPLMPNC